MAPPVVAGEEVAVSQKDWSFFNGEVQPHNPGTVWSCKRKSHPEPLEAATAGASQNKRGRTGKRAGHEKATLVGSRPGETPMDDEVVSRLRAGVPTSPTPSPITNTSHFGNPVPTADDELTITRVNRLTPPSTPPMDDEVIITGVNIRFPTSAPSRDAIAASGDEVTITGANISTPPSSVSPPTKIRTATTTAPRAEREQSLPKKKGNASGRATTYTRSKATPYDVSRANMHLARTMPWKTGIDRKRWITNPEEFPSLEKPMEQGAEQVDDDPGAIFEVDKRGVRVPASSAQPQGNTVMELEGAQSEEINPYEDSDDEVSWQGSGELVVEEGETHVHPIQEEIPPVAVAPTPTRVPTSLSKNGRRVKLTEEEKKARRRQRDRERYQRKKGAAAGIPGAQITPPKKPARRSPAAPKTTGAAKCTPAKPRNAETLTPAVTPQDEVTPEDLALAQYGAQDPGRKAAEWYDASESSDEDEDDDEEFNFWEQIGLEIENLPLVVPRAENEVDKQTDASSDVSSDEGGDDDNGGFDMWEQIGLEIQKLPPADRTAELEVDKDAGVDSSVRGSNGAEEANVVEAEDHHGDLLLSTGEGDVSAEGDDNYINSLFEE